MVVPFTLAVLCKQCGLLICHAVQSRRSSRSLLCCPKRARHGARKRKLGPETGARFQPRLLTRGTRDLPCLIGQFAYRFSRLKWSSPTMQTRTTNFPGSRCIFDNQSMKAGSTKTKRITAMPPKVVRRGIERRPQPLCITDQSVPAVSLSVL